LLALKVSWLLLFLSSFSQLKRNMLTNNSKKELSNFITSIYLQLL
jgi:hypothetical protein